MGQVPNDNGNGLEYERLQAASLIVGRGSGRPEMHRRVATKRCVRRLQEASQGWTSEGTKWWRKWMARLDQWARDDLHRLQQKKLFEQV